MVAWDDSAFIAFDFETSGELPEYALQPWRVAQGTAWATSLAWCEKAGKSMRIEGGLDPSRDQMEAMLRHAIDNKLTVCGWNVIFDIQWLMAYGLTDLCMQVKWLDGMLLWRHYFIEPEYDADAGKKKSYRLKACVAELLPSSRATRKRWTSTRPTLRSARSSTSTTSATPCSLCG